MTKECLAQVEERMKRFYELLRQQYHIYETVGALCNNEKAYIERSDVTRLRQSIDERSKMIDALSGIQKEFEILKDEWNTARHSVSPALRKDITALIEQFKLLMEDLVTIQRTNEQFLYERNIQTSKQLQQVRKGKQATKAYSAYGNNTPHSRLMDQKQ